jgi:MFS family permease|tara:strand:- start:609 stop:1811 length:1203 start_codon:yes stop_codon:yes gene_type:complete
MGWISQIQKITVKIRRQISEATTAPGMVMISLSAIPLGAAIGGYLPLISLWMETFDISFQRIGIVCGAAALGVVSSAYFAPKLAAKYGYIVTINVGLIVAAIMTIAFRFTDNFGLWLVFRFVGGLGLGLHWVLTEAWLANIVAEKYRTRVMAIYATAISIGFAVGPVVIWLFGALSIIPFVIMGGLLILAAIPILKLKGLEPKDNQTHSASPLILIKRAPTVASACVVVGSVDLALISLLPAMITRTPEAAPILALIIVPAMALGATVLQYPIAILADKYGLRKVGVITVCAGLIFASLIPFFLGSILVTLIFGFLAAGLVYALYSIGLAMLSRRFSGAEIVAANAGFVILFELSNLMGPWVAGFLLDINMRLGLPIFTLSIGIFYVAISWIRRHTNANY